jgi:hypothetical protein
MKASITDHNVNLEGFKYFVGAASGVSFGGFGQKETPIGFGKLNYLNQWDTIPAPKLAEVKLIITTLEVEFADHDGINLFAGIKVPGLANGKVSLTIGDFNSGKVKLMKVSPAGDSELVRQINDSPKVIDKLIEFGGKARIVESVLIAIEAELHSEFTAGLSSKGAVIVDGGIMVKAEKAADWKNEVTVDVGMGTCIGYSLDEPQWDATRDKNKTAVTSLRPDEQGL